MIQEEIKKEEKKEMEKNKTAGLVLGILSLVLGTISFFVFWWMSIVGLVLGIIGVVISSPKALSILGICVSGSSLLVFVLTIMILLS